MVMERWRPSRLRNWSPFEDMERFLSSEWPFRTMWRRLPAEDMCWAPAIEMYEKDNHFIVRAELPGMKKEDVDISATADTLTIKGERKASEEVSDEDYYRSELCYGSFSRSISMLEAIDAKNIEATFDNGMLEIKVPKSEEAKPRKIQIKAK
jgi:HSP20 family protein